MPTARRAAILAWAEAIAPARRIALSTHVNADGDGCGSQAALARLLMQRGHTVWIVNPTPWPEMFRFLLGQDVQDRSAEGEIALREADQLVVLDISDVGRLGTLAPAVRALQTPPTVIDHHLPGDEPPGPVMVSDTTACATGELIYDVAVTLGLDLTIDVATALYTAILTDTGGFRFSNTSPRCHAVASALLAAGVDPEAMYRRIYASVPMGRLRLIAEALTTLDSDASVGLSWIELPAGAMERHGVRSEDLDGIAEYPRSIAGTRCALFFRDLGHGKVKLSFRSTGSVDVHALARQFGGGGHAKASGALIEGRLDEVRARVIAATRAFLAATPA
jgi:bifunctional oligoribonuclease and PAP phosphatase NrnA